MNITEDNKREPLHITIDFYINENHEWYVVNYMYVGGNKELTRIDDMSYADLGKLIECEIKECI